jgi:hypothetical protein
MCSLMAHGLSADLSKPLDFRGKIVDSNLFQTVRKLAIWPKMVDQNADFRDRSGFGRREASKI